MKVGAIDFDEEISLIRNIRSRYPAGDISIRLDANGAFSADDVYEKLDKLAGFDIHSISNT